MSDNSNSSQNSNDNQTSQNQPAMNASAQTQQPEYPDMATLEGMAAKLVRPKRMIAMDSDPFVVQLSEPDPSKKK